MARLEQGHALERLEHLSGRSGEAWVERSSDSVSPPEAYASTGARRGLP